MKKGAGGPTRRAVTRSPWGFFGRNRGTSLQRRVSKAGLPYFSTVWVVKMGSNKGNCEWRHKTYFWGAKLLLVAHTQLFRLTHARTSVLWPAHMPVVRHFGMGPWTTLHKACHCSAFLGFRPGKLEWSVCLKETDSKPCSRPACSMCGPF